MKWRRRPEPPTPDPTSMENTPRLMVTTVMPSTASLPAVDADKPSIPAFVLEVAGMDEQGKRAGYLLFLSPDTAVRVALGMLSEMERAAAPVMDVSPDELLNVLKQLKEPDEQAPAGSGGQYL